MMRFLCFVVLAAACDVKVGGKCVDPVPFALRQVPPRDCPAAAVAAEPPFDPAVIERAVQNGYSVERAKNMIRFAESSGD